MTGDKVVAQVEMLPEPFNEAFMGVIYNEEREPIPVYDQIMCIAIAAREYEESESEAHERIQAAAYDFPMVLVDTSVSPNVLH